jgi:hypothetical protein
MRNATCLVAALGLVTLTAGCMQDTYPSTAYNAGYSPGYSSGYGYSTGYNTAYSTPRSERYWNSARRDYDGDGIPNRYDRDANGDGVPDRYQGRYASRY